MIRLEFVGDWFCVGSPTIEGIQAGYNARLDVAFVATPAGWRFYLDPCPGGMTRVLNQILAGEAVVTPAPHLSVYREGNGLTWFGQKFDLPVSTAGNLLGRVAQFVKRIRKTERLAGQALMTAEAEGPTDYGLCRVLVDECGKTSVIIPQFADGYPTEIPGEDWVHRAAWFGFNCWITRDYDLIPA